MKWGEGPGTLSSPSVGPQGRACPGRGVKSKDIFTAVALARLGADTGPPTGAWGGEPSSLGSHCSGAFVILPIAVIQARACWCRLQEACLGWTRIGRSSKQWPSSSSSTQLGLVPSHSLGCKLQQQGWDPTLGRCHHHPACLGLRAGLDNESQGCTGYSPKLFIRIQGKAPNSDH